MTLQLQFAFTPGWVEAIVLFCTIFLKVQVVKLKGLKNEKGYPPKLCSICSPKKWACKKSAFGWRQRVCDLPAYHRDVLPGITQGISVPLWLSPPLWFDLAVVSSELFLLPTGTATYLLIMQPVHAVAPNNATFSSGLREDFVPVVELQPSNGWSHLYTSPVLHFQLIVPLSCKTSYA